MRKYYDVAVTFGGISGENEVSVITGAMVCNVLKKGGMGVLPVYIDRDGTVYCGEELADVTAYRTDGYKKCAKCAMSRGGFVLFSRRGAPKRKVDAGCIVNCCHGGAYEGGAVAGAAEFNCIPFASARIFESAAFMDKYYTKLVLQSLGVKIADYCYSRSSAEAVEWVGKRGYPVIVKPATLGSSIGIAKADDIGKLKEALAVAFELDDGVLIEDYLSPRREINCAAYMADGKVVSSPLEEVSSQGAVLSYDDKYSGGGQRVFPAELDKEQAESIRKTTEYVYFSLNMRGIVRFDYIICGGEAYLSEINTVPGSLSHYLISDGYGDFFKKLCAVIAQAKADFAERGAKKIIKTGILNDVKPSAKIK